LPRPLDQAAASKAISDPAITRKLSIKYVVRCNALRKAARANDLYPTLILPDENGASMPVIAMRNRI
jgi:hypothetical protein